MGAEKPRRFEAGAFLNRVESRRFKSVGALPYVNLLYLTPFGKSVEYRFGYDYSREHRCQDTDGKGYGEAPDRPGTE